MDNIVHYLGENMEFINSRLQMQLETHVVLCVYSGQVRI